LHATQSFQMSKKVKKINYLWLQSTQNFRFTNPHNIIASKLFDFTNNHLISLISNLQLQFNY
jgi:hypothetical protein